MNKTIKLKNICHHIKNVEILKDINCTFYAGDIVSIIGLSGSGKTTLLNILYGLEKPLKGEVYINDKCINTLKESKLTKYRRENMTYIFQDLNLVDYLNVRDNILLISKLTKTKLDLKKFEYVIDKLNLANKLENKINYLSGGEKQKVAIARSIMCNSNIILADEPTGSLDIKDRNNITQLLKDLCLEYNKTLILVTHDPYVAIESDSIFIIDNKTLKKYNGIKNVENVERYLLNSK